MLPFAVFGWTEAIPIILILLLLFGARKLPELARGLGSSVNEFKKGMAEGAKDDSKSSTDVSSTPSSGGPGNGKPHNN
ncbi:MAG: twin-arginine translocase TatA/TatE family subunit [Planctomycetes bacterium]|nr:twin-arginine translocase TatA/TatE family subunit [Planctomycetota bacterium]